ncbi:MAG: hypothetical protein JNM44_13435 [Chitinophagaceae bacterium]|nr:hypothetical protein [Chitinophagaceae bacterium]
MRKWIFTAILASTSLFSLAQGSSEIGFSTGFSNYLGDLQPQAYTFRDPGVALGMMVKQSVTAHIGFRAFMNYMRISGSDASSGQQSLINRNLSFRSFVFEYGGAVEVNVLPFDPFNPNGSKGKRFFAFTPYFYGGINMFHFNPKTYYNGQWVALQPLNTEGQNSTFNSTSSYNLTQFAIPFGFGFKYQPNPRVVFSYEFGFRKTFTDYLDDVSSNYPDLNKLSQEKGALSAALSYRGDELSTHDGTYPVPGQMRGQTANKDWYTMNAVSVMFKFYKASKRYNPAN